MIYLSAENLSKAFPEQVLFEALTFGIFKGDRIGLIASNGAGKTSLLRILAAKEPPDQGTIFVADGVRVGLLPQEPAYPPGLRLRQLIDSEHQHVRNLLARYQQLTEAELTTAEALEELDRLSFQIEWINAWDFDRQLHQYLTRLGIDNLEASIDTMSGGERKRVALAFTLANRPNLMVLDEPTNHLDLHMIEWLEEHLTQGGQTVLLVTHDRYFLDHVCTQIWELHQGKIYRHDGNYQYFLEKRMERLQIEDREWQKKNSLLKRELEWMRQTPQARTTKAKARIDQFHDLETSVRSRDVQAELHLRVKMTRLGGKIVEFKNVSKGFGARKILHRFTYTFKRGDRLGIVGPNGSGKTTLLRLLTGSLTPDAGQINIGETVVFGHYKQEGIQVAEDKRVIDVIKDIAEYIPVDQGRKISASQMLEYFLFSPTVQYKPVAKLSGGERRRLYLLTVLMQNPNVLILDEPTNDLDLMTLNRLEAFLSQYQGCLVLVSHDRYFLDRLVDHLFVLTDDGTVRDYPGTYSELRAETHSSIAAATPAGSSLRTAQDHRSRQKHKNSIQRLEKEIGQLEVEKSKLEKSLETADDQVQVVRISETIGKLMTTIDEKTNLWIELGEQYDVEYGEA